MNTNGVMVQLQDMKRMKYQDGGGFAFGLLGKGFFVSEREISTYVDVTGNQITNNNDLAWAIIELSRRSFPLLSHTLS